MLEMKVIRKDLLASGRWIEFSLVEQLAHVGADVDCAISWRDKNNKLYSEHAVERALELMYFTIADPKNKKHLRALVYLRSILADYFLGINEFNFTDEFWHNYFYDFNYAATIARGR